MAITNNEAKFLFYCTTLDVAFDSTLTLGRLKFYGDREYILSLAKQQGLAAQEFIFKDEYAEPLFMLMGADAIDSIDISDYQHANILHDLNKPVPSALHGRYTAVVDAGTMEHIFNFPVAIKNCMEALKTGGHYIGIIPVNNSMGHGFYQFSPELYYNVFSSQNGFEIIKMIITTADHNGDFGDWYEVTNPAVVGERVTLTNNNPTFLLVVARKNNIQEIFATHPQQSDYVRAWATSSVVDNDSPAANEVNKKSILRKIVPVSVRTSIKRLLMRLSKTRVRTHDLGVINKKHFKKMES